MPSIIQVGEKWRAQVRLRGFPEQTKTFKLKADANAWARKTECMLAVARDEQKDKLLKIKYTQSAYQYKNIDPRILPAHSLESFCGVYFLINSGQIVYVGKSINVLRRIDTHVKQKGFEAWSWISVSPTLLDEVEQHFIKKLSPVLNKKHNGNGMAITTPKPA